MTQALLLVAWPYNGEVLTSFRFATGYNLPGVYTGNATLTQISSKVNDTGFEVIYRCQNCFSWDQEGTSGHVETSTGTLILGRASASTVPSNPECPAEISFRQHESFGQFGAPLAGITKAQYPDWAALATKVVPGECGGDNAPPPTTPVCAAEMANQTFDYIIVGAGAGGIPVADRLSEKGHSVLLIEKGPPSAGMWGGNMKPLWLEKTDLTRFDVPGLCNQIWVDSDGVACLDTDQMAGCVLGGGTAVNAGLWWKVRRLQGSFRGCILICFRRTRRIGMKTSPAGGTTPISGKPPTAHLHVSQEPRRRLKMGKFTCIKDLTLFRTDCRRQDGRMYQFQMTPRLRRTILLVLRHICFLEAREVGP